MPGSTSPRSIYAPKQSAFVVPATPRAGPSHGWGGRRPALVANVREACTDLGAWMRDTQLPVVYREEYNIGARLF